MDNTIIFASGGAAALLILLMISVPALQWRERSILRTVRAEIDGVRSSLAGDVERLRTGVDSVLLDSRSVAADEEWHSEPPAEPVFLGDRISTFLESGETTRTVAALVGVRCADVDLVARVTSLLGEQRRLVAR